MQKLQETTALPQKNKGRTREGFGRRGAQISRSLRQRGRRLQVQERQH